MHEFSLCGTIMFECMLDFKYLLILIKNGYATFEEAKANIRKQVAKAKIKGCIFKESYIFDTTNTIKFS